MLTEVTEARASATRITVTPEQLTDPGGDARFAAGAEPGSPSSLQRLQEAYPELRTSEQFATLHVAARRHREPDRHRAPRLQCARCRPIIPRSAPSRR